MKRKHKASHILSLLKDKIPYSHLHISNNEVPALIVKYNNVYTRIVYFAKRKSFRVYETHDDREGVELKLYSDILDYYSNKFGWIWESRGLADHHGPVA